MADLVFECFSEEIPARMQRGAAEQLQSKLVAALGDVGLKHAGVLAFVSPRHLAVTVSGLPDKQPDKNIERKGPKVGAPQPAIDGFLKSTGLTLDQCETRMVGKDEVYFATSNEKGKPTAEAVQVILEDILKGFHWPKSQRWGDHDIAWVRPLQAMLCLLDGAVVPVRFGHIVASNITYGHRFLAPAAIVIAKPSDYVSALRSAHVLVDAAERQSEIHGQLSKAAASKNLLLNEDAGLLEEVTGLVEWPTVLVGEFEADYLKLPPEVLVSEMKHHQKYFAMKKADGTLSNQFLITSNMITSDGGKAVCHGNARVLRARLEDGAFYWNQDRKKKLDDWAQGLADVIFHAKLGTIAQKVERIVTLSEIIAQQIGADVNKSKRAAMLCKADLTSGMVGEFPELQGIMGRYYAIDQKEDTVVADAIRDHYKPLGAVDNVPIASVSVVVSLADKLDSLSGMFAVGEKPTGSKDPFALRRAALGVLRIVRENNLRIGLNNLIPHATNLFVLQAIVTQTASEKCGSEIVDFFIDRLKVMLREEGISHDVVAAVISGNDDDVVRIAAKVKALSGFLSQDDGLNLLAAYRRACNILAAEEKRDGVTYQGAPEAKHFVQDEERALFAALEGAKAPVASALAKEDFAAAMRSLALLRAPLDHYFDKVMVNADDKAVRINRLSTLNVIRAAMNLVADFGLIEMKTDARELKAA